MSEIVNIIGQRIRNYRTNLGISQEKLAELSGCHPTYIGQIERGEKNATVETVEKIANALNISLEKLFEKIGNHDPDNDDIPLKFYDLLSSKNKKQQKQLYQIFVEIIKYTEL